MSDRRLSVRVSKVLQKQLAARAKKKGESESEIVRQALADYLGREEENEAYKDGPTAYDVFKAAGLIGCAGDLPPDLSTNPKYMEGFGRD